MRYTIVTVEWLTQHGLLALPTMRSNADGTKVVLHEEFVNLFPKDSFPTYRMDDPEFVQIMESEEWNHEPQPYSADYILAASAQNMVESAKKQIQTLSLTDSESLKVKSLYPDWAEFIDESLSKGMKVNYKEHLYKVRQDIPMVLESQYPGMATAALYEVVVETASGTKDDPIPYTPPMDIFKDKYYTQNDVLYICTRDSGQALTHDLSSLVGLYVNVASL